ncbi:MAG TPA: hypothetical protein VM055_00120 [Novosphingobium sp.]|nr:hypothetical protein [Novosphingobium sp.]
MRGWAIALVALAAPDIAAAQAVAVKLEWIGNDASGGVLAGKIRERIRGSADKREALERSAGPNEGLSVILQTLDPAVEWQDGIAAQSRITVYSLTINRRRSGASDDAFAGAALGYCAQADLASCAGEIVEAIDEQIARRG